jgi:hypothetical protein
MFTNHASNASDRGVAGGLLPGCLCFRRRTPELHFFGHHDGGELDHGRGYLHDE